MAAEGWALRATLAREEASDSAETASSYAPSPSSTVRGEGIALSRATRTRASSMSRRLARASCSGEEAKSSPGLTPRAPSPCRAGGRRLRVLAEHALERGERYRAVGEHGVVEGAQVEAVAHALARLVAQPEQLQLSHHVRERLRRVDRVAVDLVRRLVGRERGVLAQVRKRPLAVPLERVHPRVDHQPGRAPGLVPQHAEARGGARIQV